MNSLELYVKKSTDLMRPLLVLYGLAELVYQLSPNHNRDNITLTDAGSTYVLCADVSREDLIAKVQNSGLPHLIPAIRKPFTPGEKDKIASGIPEEQIIRRYVPDGFTGEIINYTHFKKQKSADRHRGVWDDERYPIWAHICSYFARGTAMRKTYPLTVHLWHAHKQYPEASHWLITSILDVFSLPDRDLDEISSSWLEHIRPALQYDDMFERLRWASSKSTLRALSVVSPGEVQGTGAEHSTKADKLRQSTVFWLELYLAFAGFISQSLPHIFGNQISLYTVLPGTIKYIVLRNAIQLYRCDNRAKYIYQKSEDAGRDYVHDYLLLWFWKYFLSRNELPADSSLVEFQFIDVNSHIPYGHSITNIPRVFLAEDEYRTEVVATTEKLSAILRMIDFKDQQITAIINNFITKQDLQSWIELVLNWQQSGNQSRPVGFNLQEFVAISEAFTTSGDISMADKKYAEIFKNDGFMRIARAINYCTTYALYLKHEKNQHVPFKIRSQLGLELIQACEDEDSFIERLTNFIRTYQKESSTLRADGIVRPKISLQDLIDLMILIDEYDRRKIAQLLVASGYCTHYPGTDEKSTNDEDEV